jgi:hypothetical protein
MIPNGAGEEENTCIAKILFQVVIPNTKMVGAKYFITKSNNFPFLALP